MQRFYVNRAKIKICLVTFCVPFDLVYQAHQDHHQHQVLPVNVINGSVLRLLLCNDKNGHTTNICLLYYLHCLLICVTQISFSWKTTESIKTQRNKTANFTDGFNSLNQAGTRKIDNLGQKANIYTFISYNLQSQLNSIEWD